jgi:hypothetical protein
MKSIEELLQLAAEGDEEAQAEIKARFEATQQESLSAKRELKLKTDSTLKERYPRALRAWEKGKLRLSENMTEDELLDALREKEEEYAEMGVPVNLQPAATEQHPPTGEHGGDDDDDDPDDDPAKALAGAGGSAGPAGQPRDHVAEYFDALAGSTTHDRARANRILVELQKPELRHKIEEITRRLEAQPITPATI